MQADEVLQAAVDRGAAPGLVAMAVTKDGPFYNGAFGLRRPGGPAMTADTVFHLASMTKALTSVAAMQLVEQGRLALDRPISDVLPQLADREVLDGFAADGAPRMRPAAGPITLRHLLTHTAGYGYDTWNPEIGRFNDHGGHDRRAGDWDAVRRQPLLFDPGTRWNYGINTDLVGKAVEAVSGQPLDSYWQQHVFWPLGMVDTTVSLTPEQQGRLAQMYRRDKDGAVRPIDMARGTGPGFFMGGGALCGTGPDYARFLRAMLDGGGGVLRPDTVAEMGRNHIGDLLVEPMRSALPDFSADAEFFPGLPKKWGLGFMLTPEAAPTGRRAGSLAWAGIANTYYWIDPDAGIAGLVLMQHFPFADPAALAVLNAFETAIYRMAGASPRLA